MAIETLAAVLPIAGQALGIAGSVGQLLGGSRMSPQQQAQWQQFYLQNYLARRQLEMAEASEQDALGNRRIYIPGTGWVTIAEPTTRTAMGRQVAETAERLGGDSQSARFERQANTVARGRERSLADSLLAQQGEGYVSRRDLTDMLLASSVADAGAASAQAGSELALGGLRQGVSSDGAVRMLQRPATASRVSAVMAAPLRGMDAYEAQEGARGGRLGNRYNLFANRASMGGDVPIPDVNLTSLDRNLARAVAPQAIGSAMGIRSPAFNEGNRNVQLAGVGASLEGFGSLLERLLRQRGEQNPGVPVPTRPETFLEFNRGPL